MDVTTLLRAVRNAVKTDGDTATWCRAQYDRVHRVYVGMDVRNPPGSDRYPLVHIFPRSKSSGYDAPQQSVVVGVTCGIHSAAFEQQWTPGWLSSADGWLDSSDAWLIEAIQYAGIEDVETFREYVEAAITGASFTGNIYVAGVDTNYETIEFFPYFLATMEMRFAEHMSMGDDPFT